MRLCWLWGVRGVGELPGGSAGRGSGAGRGNGRRSRSRPTSEGQRHTQQAHERDRSTVLITIKW